MMNTRSYQRNKSIFESNFSIDQIVQSNIEFSTDDMQVLKTMKNNKKVESCQKYFEVVNQRQKRILRERSIQQILMNQHLERMDKKYEKKRNPLKVVYKVIVDEMFQGLILIVTLVLQIVQTYNTYKMDTCIQCIQSMISLFFMIDLIKEYGYSGGIISFIKNSQNMIDFVTILPIFSWVYVLVTQNHAPIKDQDNLVIVLELLKILRALRLLKLHRIYMKKDQQEIRSVTSMNQFKKKQITLQVGSKVVCIIYIITMLLEFMVNIGIGLKLEQNFDNDRFRFDQSLYFVMTTITSVGYGDIHPANTNTRIFIIFMLLFILVFISKQSFILSFIKQKQNQYKDYRTFPSQLKECNFILLLGSIDQYRLYNFLFEIYNNHDHDYRYNKVKVLMISNNDPSQDVQSVLSSKKYRDNIFYMNGDIFDNYTLQQVFGRLNVTQVFIFSDEHYQFRNNTNKLDCFAVLVSKVIKQYEEVKSRIYVQLASRYLEYSIQSDWDQVISKVRMKCGLVIQNLRIKGFLSFIQNLVITHQPINTNNYQQIYEYFYSIQQQIFTSRFSKDYHIQFINQSFQDVCLQIKQQHDILLIGILKFSNDQYHCLINPTSLIQIEDIGIFIGNSKKRLEKVFTTKIRTSNEYNGLLNQYIELNLDHNKTKNRNTKVIQARRYYNKEQKVDFTGVLQNHIIIFGPFVILDEMLNVIRSQDSKTVLYITNDQNLDCQLLIDKYSNLIYLECQYYDLKLFDCLAIQDCQQVILMSWYNSNCKIQDHKLLTIVSILQNNYQMKDKLTIELMDDNNLKYIQNDDEWDKLKELPLVYWTQYQRSNILFNSSFDYLMAHTFKQPFLPLIMNKLVQSQSMPNVIDIQENDQICQIEVCNEFINQEISSVQEYLIQKGIIILAVWRNGNYSITNPSNDTVIDRNDKLTIIGYKYQNYRTTLYSDNCQLEQLNHLINNQFVFEQKSTVASKKVHSKQEDQKEDIVTVAKNLIAEDQNLIQNILSNEEELSTAQQELINKLQEQNSNLEEAIKQNQQLQNQFAKQMLEKHEYK